MSHITIGFTLLLFLVKPLNSESSIIVSKSIVKKSGYFTMFIQTIIIEHRSIVSQIARSKNPRVW